MLSVGRLVRMMKAAEIASLVVEEHPNSVASLTVGSLVCALQLSERPSLKAGA